MPINWSNSAEAVAGDIQLGGPGNAWANLDPAVMIDALSGGGRSRDELWGRGNKGGLAYQDFVYTSNPDPFTGNIGYRLSSDNFLKKLTCPFTIRARQYCGLNMGVMTSYGAPGMLSYPRATVTSFNYSDDLAKMDGQGGDVQRQAAITAAFEVRYTKVAHDDISQTTLDVAANKVINIGQDICNGSCGVASNVEDSYMWVSDKDSSPSYAGNPAPYLVYTLDGGQTRTSVRIGLFTNADALDIVLAGDRVVVFSDTKNPAYAKIADIYNGVTDPLLWSTSSGLTALAGTSNNPSKAVAVDSSTIIAVGTAGRIFLSTDGGLSFSVIVDTTVLTSQNLNAVAAQPSGSAYVGGNAGVFIRLAKAPGQATFTASLITVKDASNNTLSANINTVQVPPGRADQCYLGTAGGEIWRSDNVNATRVLFTNKTFDRKGIGSITDIQFVGYLGEEMWVIQTNTDSTSRVLRDFSGGNLGNDVEIVGDFTNPSNFKMNSIAPATVNDAFTVGEVHETYAFTGKIRPA